MGPGRPAAYPPAVPFEVTDRTLLRLEWPALVARLAEGARTPRGRARAAEPARFAGSPEEARAWLAETSEARALLDQGELPPLGGVQPVEPVLARLAKGGVAAPSDLLALASTLAAVGATGRWLGGRAGRAPRLAEAAALLGDHGALVREIEHSLDPEGEVRDAASAELARARGEARGLSGEVQRRIGRLLQEPRISAALQDSYFTVRGDRYVLPVRADARGRVPGIVHDASASGTTLFVEPEAVVELNNRLKRAELAVERETRRVLVRLSGRARERAPTVEADLALLAELDLAFARGALSRALDAVEPVLDEDGAFRLHQLRHPLLPPEEVVPNDLVLGETFTVLVISGPNAGGKTVALKSLGLAALLARAGCHVPAAPGARVAAVERVMAAIGDEQDLRESLSTFSAHMKHLAEVVRCADRSTLAVLDEVGVGTDPGEGAALAQAVLEALADAGARVVVTTPYTLLKERAAVDERFANASFEFDEETGAPTWRLRMGTPGASSATVVAARMGMPAPVLERAAALLEREDRQLDRMLAELGTSRAALDRERREASLLRAESESARDAYRQKLERLQERRDALFASMRADLDRAFRSAHAEVAGVIRDLQRGGGARGAARARERLLALERDAQRQEERQRHRAPEARRSPVDWRHARPGDPVRLPTGATGTLVSLPDRRGRVVVASGSARVAMAADALAPAAPEDARAERAVPRVAVQTSTPAESVPGRIDLRGLRVDEALDRVGAALDAAAGAGRARVEIVHGLGTGALRDAVRRFLRASPYVTRTEAGDPLHGGEGLTIAHLTD